MDVSPNNLDKLFERYFNRGAVLSTEMHFHSGISKKKYLIVLNQNPAESETLFFLTTSKLEFFQTNPSFKDHLVIKPGTVPFFPLETVINCNGVQAMGRGELKRRYREKQLGIVGHLPKDIMVEIDQMVRASRYISPRHKKAILGE
ncbi:MAG: hypothetical protein HYZ83_07460 [Candidatus Omnitrophica bacterium]|nr:hypothetical protein [Candidatus Omnitrophota bacterium]